MTLEKEIQLEKALHTLESLVDYSELSESKKVKLYDLIDKIKRLLSERP
jgi:hypothetical protein